MSGFTVNITWVSTVFFSVSLLATVGCDRSNQAYDPRPIRSVENQLGTRFTELPSLSFQAPQTREIPLDFSPDAKAIWGAIGRNDSGSLFLGASSRAGPDGTAFLYEFDPETSLLEPRGDVVGQLKRLGLYIPGMGQNKLHSKFYQADDNYLYFASFDDQGEEAGINSIWGGHLWRKGDGEKDWEHLLSTPEALIAVNVSGDYVYALGYWNHVLYQFNTRDRQVERVVVGSVEGHVSRNFLVDPRGHAYVPAVSYSDSGSARAYLNEYDPQLNLVGSYAMPSYQSRKMKGHNGIVGYTSMKSGDIYFTTSDGGLYELRVSASSGDKLVYRGMMHPDGKAYIPSLFPLDGSKLIAAVGRAQGQKNYEWLIYEPRSEYAASYPLDTGDLIRPLLYGTATRDDEGNFYLVGRSKRENGGGSRPVLLEISLASLWPSR